MNTGEFPEEFSHQQCREWMRNGENYRKSDRYNHHTVQHWLENFRKKVQGTFLEAAFSEGKMTRTCTTPMWRNSTALNPGSELWATGWISKMYLMRFGNLWCHHSSLLVFQALTLPTIFFFSHNHSPVWWVSQYSAFSSICVHVCYIRNHLQAPGKGLIKIQELYHPHAVFKEKTIWFFGRTLPSVKSALSSALCLCVWLPCPEPNSFIKPRLSAGCGRLLWLQPKLEQKIDNL